MTAAYRDLFAGAYEAPGSAPDLGLRVYQSEAREAVQRQLEAFRSTLVVLPTGCGKTRTAGSIIWDRKLAGQRSLILCPTITLVRQMYSDLRGLGLRPSIEQADNRADRLADVVVASVATLRGLRLKSWDRDSFGLVIADEAHRSTAELYTEIFAHFESAKVLGLTATPDRSDGVALGNVFESVAYEMTMLQAITDGWLVPLRFNTAVTDFDPKALRTVAGEVDPGSVAAEITRSGLLHEAANTLAELSAGERTVAFLPTVASSKAFVAELLAREVAAAHVDGTTPDGLREDTFARFKAGDIRVLSNVAVLTEGWDCPAASVIALLNPTKSRSRLTQMIGRGTRLAPGKTHALVIDFCPGRLKRGRLASPADALAGKMLDDKVYDQLAKDGDLAEEIKKAERTVEELEERKRKAEEAARAKAARVAEMAALARRKAFNYGVQEHDTNAILGGVGGFDRGYVVNDVEGPSDEERRKAAGLCSPKQAKILARHGLNPDMKWKLAREAIDAIARNNWKLPGEIKNNKKFYAKGKAPQDVADLADALLEQLRGKR